MFSDFAEIKDKSCQKHLEKIIYNCILDHDKKYSKIAVVCIGTDRSTGDSLGPFVGTKLSQRKISHSISIYGTIDNPAMALNLQEVIDKIPEDYLIIAVDAALGTEDRIGRITVKDVSMRPGEAVGKNLPPVGDVSITGNINVGGYMDHMIIQSTRLSFVLKLADCITNALNKSLTKILKEKYEADLEAACCE
jgi:putative sporulation protein YyaC